MSIPPLFQRHIIVDWSSNSTPKSGKDSIWIATTDATGTTLQNPRTRAEAKGLLDEALTTATAAGERLLIGFDFAFGYPAGAAGALAGGDWQALWQRITDLSTDGPANANNRFDVASTLNAQTSGDGPFWCYPFQHHGRYASLPFTKPQGYGDTLPPSKRHAETQASGAQEVWKLSGAGAVGGQTLTGIPVLQALRAQHDLAIWPFEQSDTAHLAVEVFPSLIDPDPSEVIRDAGQVRALATAIASLDAQGRLSALLADPAEQPPAVTNEEGWILGLGFETDLRTAAQRDLAHAPL